MFELIKIWSELFGTGDYATYFEMPFAYKSPAILYSRPKGMTGFDF